MVAVASLLAAVGGGVVATAGVGGRAGWDSLYWRLALSLTTREQRELGMKLRSAVISSEWVQYPHVLASGGIIELQTKVREDFTITKMAQLDTRLFF